MKYLLTLLLFVSTAHAYTETIIDHKGWSICGPDVQCLKERAAHIANDTRTFVYFEAPVSFYVRECFGWEPCYGGGSLDWIDTAYCGALGVDAAGVDETEPDHTFWCGRYKADRAWSLKTDVAYFCSASRRSNARKHPGECFARKASQTKRECAKDFFSDTVMCGSEKGQLKRGSRPVVIQELTIQ